jgi:hypothetical protein
MSIEPACGLRPVGERFDPYLEGPRAVTDPPVCPTVLDRITARLVSIAMVFGDTRSGRYRPAMSRRESSQTHVLVILLSVSTAIYDFEMS